MHLLRRASSVDTLAGQRTNNLSNDDALRIGLGVRGRSCSRFTANFEDGKWNRLSNRRARCVGVTGARAHCQCARTACMHQVPFVLAGAVRTLNCVSPVAWVASALSVELLRSQTKTSFSAHIACMTATLSCRTPTQSMPRNTHALVPALDCDNYSTTLSCRRPGATPLL